MRVCFFNSDKYATFEETNTEEAVYWTDNDVSLVEPCQSSNVSQLDDLIECLEQQAEYLLGADTLLKPALYHQKPANLSI